MLTVNFLNCRTPLNLALMYLEAKHWVFFQKDANGIANSEDPDQTAPLNPEDRFSRDEANLLLFRQETFEIV